MSTVIIPLGLNGRSGKVAIIDEIDYPIVSMFNWYHYQGYARTNLGRMGLTMHQLIAGLPASPIEVDHINHNTLDNRNCNLRLATAQQNRQNRKVYASNKVGVRGLLLYRGKYKVQIRYEGRQHYLGLYKTIKEASDVYDAAALKFHGQFACLNNYQVPATND